MRSTLISASLSMSSHSDGLTRNAFSKMYTYCLSFCKTHPLVRADKRSHSSATVLNVHRTITSRRHARSVQLSRSYSASRKTDFKNVCWTTELTVANLEWEGAEWICSAGCLHTAPQKCSSATVFSQNSAERVSATHELLNSNLIKKCRVHMSSPLFYLWHGSG